MNTQLPHQRLKLTSYRLGARNKTTGQALAEFALVLPLLLIIVFGIIEFARIFQAYLVIVNSARFAVRYAVTGEFDDGHCVDYDGDGSVCDGDARNAEENHARLLSIYDVINQTSVAILRNDSAPIGNPGYFHYSVCSSNEPFLWDPELDACINGDTGMPVDDPGDPSFGTTRVMVAITFEHPLILPIISSISPTAHLHAERTGILEQFRVTRVLGLPPDISMPSPIPATATQTQIPTTTNTPLPPTQTSTPLPTSTPTATPTPSCEDIQFGDQINISGNFIQLYASNTSSYYPATITRIDTSWNGAWHDEVDPTPIDQYFDRYSGIIYQEVINVHLAPGGASWNTDLAQQVHTGVGGTINWVFTRSFSDLLYYHAHDFNVTVSYRVGDLDCPAVSRTGRFGPEVTAESVPPGTISSPFYIQANANDPDGSINRVRFEVYNSSASLVGYQNDTSRPYCIFGDSGDVCRTRNVGQPWPNSSVPISNGNYTIYIQARDNDPTQQYTRIVHAIRLIFAPTPTPTITMTPTITPTARPTRPPTQTSTPAPATNTPVPTNNPPSPPTPQPTRTNTSLPTWTSTAVFTPTSVPSTATPTETLRPTNPGGG